MFNKRDNPGDRTPKQENKETKETTAKEATVVNQPAPAAETAAAPASEEKKS